MGGELCGCGADAIHSSDLLRAAQTAAIIGDELGLSVQQHAGLRERFYGSLEGQPSARAVRLTPGYQIVAGWSIANWVELLAAKLRADQGFDRAHDLLGREPHLGFERRSERHRDAWRRCVFRIAQEPSGAWGFTAEFER